MENTRQTGRQTVRQQTTNRQTVDGWYLQLERWTISKVLISSSDVLTFTIWLKGSTSWTVAGPLLVITKSPSQSFFNNSRCSLVILRLLPAGKETLQTEQIYNYSI